MTSLPTTTTLFTTTQTSEISTVSPLPLPVACHSLLMYLSLGLNVILVLAFFSLLASYYKLKKEDRDFEAQIQNSLRRPIVNRFTGQVGPFSLGSLEDLLNEHNERAPLIGTDPQNVRERRGFQNTSNVS